MAMPSITRCRFTVLLLLAGLAPLLPPVRLPAQDRVDAARSGRPRQRREPNRNLLTPEQWKQLDRSVDRGVGFIVKNQQEDGGFPTSASGQPAINSLCVMALLSRGHQPGKGPYGAKIERAIDYVLDMQDPRTGAIMQDRRLVGSRTDDLIYSHAISGVMLGEVYGMTTASRHDRIRSAILKGLKFTRKEQIRPKPNPDERGGWRYAFKETPIASDLSVTAWQLMFYRSARNADFDVPETWVKEAMGYVHRSFDVNERAFVYALYGYDRFATRGMVGAGIVCAGAGRRAPIRDGQSGRRLDPRHSFEPYGVTRGQEDRYHYGAFYCSQAMFQLGGDFWRKFFPRLLDGAGRGPTRRRFVGHGVARRRGELRQRLHDGPLRAGPHAAVSDPADLSAIKRSGAAQFHRRFSSLAASTCSPAAGRRASVPGPTCRRRWP